MRKTPLLKLLPVIIMMMAGMGSFASTDSTTQAATDTEIIYTDLDTTTVVATEVATVSYADQTILEIADKLSIEVDTNLTTHELAAKVADAVDAANKKQWGALIVMVLSLLVTAYFAFKRK